MPFILETDASDVTIILVLSYEKWGRLLLVAYYSKKVKAERHYIVHDHEILAILNACSK